MHDQERGSAGRSGARALLSRGPRSRNRWAAALATVATAAMLAACSSSGGGGATSANSPSGGAQPSGSSGGASTGSPSGGFDMVGYVGGKAGHADDSLAPVTIGYVNQQGGQISLPESSFGADAAVKYINDELGGIGGHPLKLSSCYIVSEESEGQKCGQQFANDPKIQAVVMGAVINGAASFHKAINGAKPVVGSISSNPVDMTATNTYILDGGTTLSYGGLMSYAKSKGYKKIVGALDTGPGGQLAQQIFDQAAKAVGIDFKAANYALGASSIVGPLVAAGAKDADALVVIGATPQCILYGNAAKQLNLFDKPTLSTPTCIDPSVKQAFGDLPPWTYTVSVNSSDTSDPEVALYLQEFEKYEKGKASGGFAGNTFEAILATAKMLNAAGGADATAAKIGQQFKDYHGAVYLGPKKLDCGGTASAPASCTDTAKVQTYHGGGKWTTDGYFSTP